MLGKYIFSFIVLFISCSYAFTQDSELSTENKVSMKILEGYTYFSEKFKDELDLDKEQVKELNNVEYQVAKDYHWNIIETEDDLKKEWHKRILAKLTEAQQAKYHKLVKVEKEKKELQDAEYEKNKRIREKQKYSSLNLSSEQMQKVIDYHENWKTLYFDLSQSKKELSANEKISLLEQLYLLDIFDDQQKLLYADIKKREEEEGKSWRIKQQIAVFKEIHNIEITMEQASVFYKLENISKDENGEYYSDFEKEKMEFDAAKKILNNDQFEIYSKILDEKSKTTEQRIRNGDSSFSKVQADIICARLEYYIQNILPLKCDARKRIDSLLTQEQKDYADSLRFTYINNLNQSKSESVAQHYRHNKNLAPNSLRETIARFNYYLVRPQLYVLSDMESLNNEKLIEALEQEEQLLASVYQEEKAFSIISYEENGGTYGFNLSKILSDYDKRINLFSLFLIDPILENNLKILVPAE